MTTKTSTQNDRTMKPLIDPTDVWLILTTLVAYPLINFVIYQLACLYDPFAYHEVLMAFSFAVPPFYIFLVIFPPKFLAVRFHRFSIIFVVLWMTFMAFVNLYVWGQITASV